MIIIRDDRNQPWTFDGERIKMLGVDEDKYPESGYYANDWLEAIEILNYEGYLSHDEHRDEPEW